jgi:hypothetical protein
MSKFFITNVSFDALVERGGGRKQLKFTALSADYGYPS